VWERVAFFLFFFAFSSSIFNLYIFYFSVLCALWCYILHTDTDTDTLYLLSFRVAIAIVKIKSFANIICVEILKYSQSPTKEIIEILNI
jgi:hypothetical protein